MKATTAEEKGETIRISTAGMSTIHDTLRRQFWPVETTVEAEEAFRQPGGPAVRSSLRAGNRSVHLSARREEEEEEEELATMGLPAYQPSAVAVRPPATPAVRSVR